VHHRKDHRSEGKKKKETITREGMYAGSQRRGGRPCFSEVEREWAERIQTRGERIEGARGKGGRIYLKTGGISKTEGQEANKNEHCPDSYMDRRKQRNERGFKRERKCVV